MMPIRVCVQPLKCAPLRLKVMGLKANSRVPSVVGWSLRIMARCSACRWHVGKQSDTRMCMNARGGSMQCLADRAARSMVLASKNATLLQPSCGQHVHIVDTGPAGLTHSTAWPGPLPLCPPGGTGWWGSPCSGGRICMHRSARCEHAAAAHGKGDQAIMQLMQASYVRQLCACAHAWDGNCHAQQWCMHCCQKDLTGMHVPESTCQ